MQQHAYTVALLPGDGIGPEVTRQAEVVLEAAARAFGFELTTAEHPVGGAGIDASSDPLPASTLEAAHGANAVFLGAVGGPAWDGIEAAKRPERGLLRLRKELGVFANLRPVTVPDVLAERSPLRSEIVAGTDLLIVRELTGGIYFGAHERTGDHASDVMAYSVLEVERIARVAFETARGRRGRVTSVDKANVLASSALWRETVARLHQEEYSDLEVDHLYVDNAAMQLVRDPRAFDVVVTGNLFGDILSDLAATLPGTLGLLPSASVGGDVGLFEPVHGSAPDLEGRDVANPIAAILSAAMLLDDLDESEAAAAVRRAVDSALEAGTVTPDLGGSAGTAAVGHAVAQAVLESVPTPA
ncbi:3-isopropylmalate dehydrogenase [Rubrivirga sp.]|uniref:3-isopropylmalate dehydrogenase n=1 Tax=Rubrivirga sp. TaxID=1885344 RepID=UPI003C77F5F3